MPNKSRAPRNRTLTLDAAQQTALARQLLRPDGKKFEAGDIRNRIICGDLFQIVDLLPDSFVDLMIIDPPYNLDKDFNGVKFEKSSGGEYRAYLESWFPKLMRLLKPHASLYMCGDWQCSGIQQEAIAGQLTIRNRIVWQREKGRAAGANWKNCCEDIWFATVGNTYIFNLDAVKIRRRVLAPYRRADGRPKDWQSGEDGNFRMTAPPNFWDDISVPYWSMPENTDHPTQKPEKLLAKLILASSNPGDMVFDPFSGSGSTAVTAKKLGRDFAAVELNEEYCCWAAERLRRAGEDRSIQGYVDGIFWERNTLSEQKRLKKQSAPEPKPLKK